MDQIIEIVDSFARGDTVAALTETGRFLYVYNSTTLIASVGAIVGLVLLGSLLWIAITTASKPDKGFYHYNGGNYRKRRFSGTETEEEKNYTFIELLIMLDETFRKMEINNFDCQKRAVCEAHKRYAEGTAGPIVRRITYIFGKLDDKPLSSLEPESAEFLAKYLEAADRGERNEDCAKLYAACNRSLHDFVALSQNQIPFHSEKDKFIKN